MEKFVFAILRTEFDDDYLKWENVCRERQDRVDWDVIDITRTDWLECVKARPYDGLLAMPPGITSALKTMYDERVYILHTVLGLPVYPSMEEIQIYENKKYLSYWLAANGIPHPDTKVFYNRNEALDFAASTPLPVVGKMSVGASGRGVSILKTREEAVQYVKDIFSGKGPARSTGPNWKKKGLLKRAIRKLLKPAELKGKLEQYRTQRSELQREFAIFQEFIPHDFEWRVVRIGDSFFAHKKIVRGDKASGTLLKGYENPPLELFDFVKKITDLKDFWSQSVDIFIGPDGRYLVNEMQCTFGQSDPYQMLVDGRPGRYRMRAGEWVFEPGDFNRFASFLLRLDHFMEILGENRAIAADHLAMAGK